MARIRTVKPELWTDEDFVELSPMARLLFVAGLNFASDYGVLADKPRSIKMQCLPADDADIDALIAELVPTFWIRCVAPDDANVLVIRNFRRHQKVDKPSAGRWGNPDDWPNPPGHFPDGSAKVPRTVDDPSSLEGKGREGKGSSLSPERPLAVVRDDGDERETAWRTAVSLIVDALLAQRTVPPASERAWRHTVRRDVEATDGVLIRNMVADGTAPEQVALFVLGHGFGAEAEHQAATTSPWCDPTCPMCAGDHWIADPDDPDESRPRFIPCPNREATA